DRNVTGVQTCALPIYRRAGRQKRIFTEVLEASAIQRSPVDIHARPQQKVDAAGPRVLAKDSSHSLSELRIPRRRQSNSADSCGRSEERRVGKEGRPRT